jgi:hypothetical protein
MKTTSTLLMALFIWMASFAVPPQSKLSITVVGHENIQILVDNNRYEGQENSIVLNNLRPGSHTIKVYARNQKRTIWGNKRNNNQLIYSSTVYVRPGYLTTVRIDRYGKAQVDERAIGSNRRNNDRDDDRYDRRNDRNNDRYDRNNGGYDDYNRRPVNEQSFSSMMQNLRREYSENSRVILAKQIIDRNYFSTSQVKYMLQLFPFEHHKLDLAKYAYHHTTDQGNYYSLYDVFSYNNSREELANYIRRYK